MADICINQYNTLKIGEIIIPELPVVYTNNTDDYVTYKELKMLYDSNHKKSFKKCVTSIKKKINIQGRNNTLLYGLIIGCRINNINKVFPAPQNGDLENKDTEYSYYSDSNSEDYISE